MIIVFVLRK